MALSAGVDDARVGAPMSMVVKLTVVDPVIPANELPSVSSNAVASTLM